MASTPTKLIKSFFADAKLAATQWETADDKRAFLVNLARFVDSGFDPKKFTAKLYRRLMNCFGHIAHYNQDGFYGVWFEDDRKRAKWIQHILHCPIYGDPTWTYSDAEKVFQTWLKKWVDSQDRTLPWPAKNSPKNNPAAKVGHFQVVDGTILGPKDYMNQRGSALLDLIVAGDPDAIRNVADRIESDLDTNAAILRYLLDDHSSWVAESN